VDLSTTKMALQQLHFLRCTAPQVINCPVPLFLLWSLGVPAKEKSTHPKLPAATMRIYQRYLIKELVQIFLLAILSLLAIYILLEFFGKLDDFIENQVAVKFIVLYLANQAPFFAAQFIPLALLLATMLTLGSMGQHNEIIAFRSCGFTLYQLSLPLLIAGAVFCLLTFSLTEYVVPPTFARAKHIKTVFVKHKKEKKLLNLKDVWYTSGRNIYHFNKLDPAAKAIQGATIYRLDQSSMLVKRLDAGKIIYRQGRWVARDLYIREFVYQDGRSSLDRFQHRDSAGIAISEKPEDFLIPQKAVEEMNIRELNRYIDKVKNIGVNADEYKVQLYNKFFFPLTCLVMVLLGIPFSLGSKRSGGFARSIGISLVVGFSFWFVLSFSLALGKAGILSPLPAAIVPHALYTGLGMFLLRRNI